MLELARVRFFSGFIIMMMISFACTKAVLAKDFGTRGKTYIIAEEGFLAMIKRKLEKIDIEEENKKMQSVAKERVNNPTPVEGIKAATANRSFFFDPTYILEQDAILPCGKVLHPAGTKVNPLDHMDFERVLYFIDGRLPKQLAWVKEQLASDLNQGSEARVILVGGSVFKVEEQLGKEVYFDQSGELTTKFGIKAVPAIAEQEDKMIKIREIAL